MKIFSYALSCKYLNNANTTFTLWYLSKLQSFMCDPKQHYIATKIKCQIQINSAAEVDIAKLTLPYRI